MLSGNGRHRRPRQAPALIVAAGVTGSAIAIPLLGATSASAAETVTWDRLAECESGGAWSANPGNGYYGGLQLSEEMWEKHGGLDYAPSADQASKSQQIAVAERILDGQGPQAWPSCAPIAGLTDGGAAADVDPGDPVTPDATDSKAPEKSKEPKESKESKGRKDKTDKDAGKASDDTSKAPDSARDGEGDPSDTPDPDSASRDKNHDTGDKGDKGAGEGERADKGGDSATDGKSGRAEAPSSGGPASKDPATPADDSTPGRHRGDRADENPSSGSESGSGGDRPGRHASRGGERTEKVADGAYTVRSGDNLSAIADDLDVKGGWHELYTENKKTVGADPDLILPGQSLDLGEK
ncbi:MULTISPECIES: transglycosylase family protein [Streptomyces]|uniref:transglycosylase family protein n=1 Tax=Streptomyces TaxID=1883 RepID=UPI001E5AC1E5|nr:MULTISPECIES: transglycosylase family protein [Streptomyces]UFQ16096.1 transglycosylase family protein [Streptomyces huasconensis]WCL85700.1 transglycosylase family protein [Streptomyces sp. JCM 35825]